VIRLMPLSLMRIPGHPRIEIGTFLSAGSAARHNCNLPRNGLNLYAGNIHASGKYGLRGAGNVSFLEFRRTRIRGLQLIQYALLAFPRGAVGTDPYQLKGLVCT
jgi:hypothetical protein